MKHLLILFSLFFVSTTVSAETHNGDDPRALSTFEQTVKLLPQIRETGTREVMEYTIIINGDSTIIIDNALGFHFLDADSDGRVDYLKITDMINGWFPVQQEMTLTTRYAINERYLLLIECILQNE